MKNKREFKNKTQQQPGGALPFSLAHPHVSALPGNLSLLLLERLCYEELGEARKVEELLNLPASLGFLFPQM